MTTVLELLDGAPASGGALSTLADRLIISKRLGVSWCEAWNEAVRSTRGLHHYLASADEDAPCPLEFARARFEAAYRGLPYSAPTCDHAGCTQLAYLAGKCRLHCEVPDEEQ